MRHNYQQNYNEEERNANAYHKSGRVGVAVLVDTKVENTFSIYF